jgi:type III pantothenate kinase
MMLLLIDAGNTRIKWAVLNDSVASPLGVWVQSGSLNHQELSNSPWSQFPLQRVVISNVAGNSLRHQFLKIFQGFDIEWLVPEAQRAGIINQYRDPAQLGSDRFAAAIAAHALFPNRALIIATCGTALTIDAVTAKGEFIGGMIAPGLKLMAESLTQNTAQLPSVVKQNAMTAHFANHTEAAMISGCLAAQAGAIEYAVREFSTANPLCIISGGAASYITPSLKIPHQFIDNLVLIGLQVASC